MATDSAGVKLVRRYRWTIVGAGVVLVFFLLGMSMGDSSTERGFDDGTLAYEPPADWQRDARALNQFSEGSSRKTALTSYYHPDPGDSLIYVLGWNASGEQLGSGPANATNRSTVTLEGREWQRYAYTFSVPGKRFHVFVQRTIVGSQGYELRYVAAGSVYSDHLPAVKASFSDVRLG